MSTSDHLMHTGLTMEESYWKDENEALIVLSLKWIKPDETQKRKRPETSVMKMLQTWFNKRKLKVDCSVKRTLTDGRVVIKINPAPAITDLQRLSEQTLTGKDGNSVTVTAVSLTLPSLEVDTQIPEDASLNLPASMPEPKTDQVQLGQQSSTVSAAEEMCTCPVPVGLFWYVNHMYKEEMKRIEKENGVQMRAEVKVRFELDQKDGSPDKALNEFINLIQKSVIESSGSVIPLKFIHPDQWSNALKTIQTKENKLLVTLSSEEMTVCGPMHSQEVIRNFLNVDSYQKRNKNASLENYERAIQHPSLKIDMSTATSAMSLSQSQAATGFSGSPMNTNSQKEENLVPNSMIESSGSVIPLKFVDPDQWRDTLKIILKKENKLLVTLTSEEMTVRGPRHSQDLISKFLFGDTM